MAKNKVKIIAEIANAHQGNPELALELARASIEAGADAVKFQVYFAEELLVGTHSRFEHFKNQSFSEDDWDKIFEKVCKFGSEVYADVFGAKAIAVAAKYDLDGLKIHSSDLTNTSLLNKAAKYKRKLFLAVGGSTILEIKYALDRLANAGCSSRIVLMHGFQAYPTKVEHAALCRLKMLKEYFGDSVSLGYSDHADAETDFSLFLPLISLPFEVRYIEKHVTLDRASRGVDYYSSYEPDELANFIECVRVAEKAIGDKPLCFSQSEKVYRKTVKKQWVAARDMQKGDVINESDLVMLRTEDSVNGAAYESLIGSKLVCDVAKEQVISRNDIKNRILAVVVARSDSSRLPGKAVCPINGEPAISHLLNRLERAKDKGFLDTIAFCTTTEPSDDKLVTIASKHSCFVYRGSVEDVLARMMLAIDDHHDHNIVLRVTGDDLLIDPDYLHKTIEHHLKSNAHYTDAKQLPSGTEVEVFDSEILKLIYELSHDSSGSEYLTNYIVSNADQFHLASLPVPGRHAKNYRLTLDTKQDYEVIKNILEYFESIGLKYDYTLDDICEYFENYPKAQAANRTVRQKTTPLTVDTRINWGNYTRSPLVSVYIVNHNYGSYIKQAIDSTLNQKFRDFEVIIIDDGSTDDSRKVIECYRNNPRVSVVYQENKGLNVTCNIALKLSKGKYIMRLDADDYLDENALLVMVERLERQENAAIIFPDYYIVDRDGNILSLERRHDFSQVELLDQPAHGACSLIRKSCLLEAGGYNEKYNCQDGYDLWFKMTRDYRVTNVNLPLFYYRRHDKNLTLKEDRLLFTRHELIKEHTAEYNINNKKHLCILPIRAFPDGNSLAVRPFAGSSLLDLTLAQIRESENVTQTVVTSPDNKVLDIAGKYDSDLVLTLDQRPVDLSGYNTRIEQTVNYLLERYFADIEFDTITIVNYEYPFRKPIYIDKAINTLYLYNVDAVIAVEQKNANYYQHYGNGLVPFKTNTELNLEREFIYEEAGGIHCIRFDSYQRYGSMLSGKIGHIVMDRLSVRKAECEIDFEMLEMLFKKSVK